MLRVAVPSTSIVSSTEALHESSAASQLVKTSPVFAGEYSIHDATKAGVLGAGMSEAAPNGHGSGAKHGSSLVGEAVKAGLNGREPENIKKLSKESGSRTASALWILDNTILPIKNQMTFRKVYMVVALLTLVRTFNLGFLPTNSFSRTFPYFPLDYAAPHATSVAVDISNAPFVALFLHSSPFSLHGWASFFQEFLITLVRGIALLFYDCFEIHKLALSPATLTTLLFAFMLYPLTAWMDERIHREFYNRAEHKNIHQMPPWASNLGKKGFKYLRYLLIASAIWPFSDPLSREANLVLVICSVWMSVVKRMLKNGVNMLYIRPALRPANSAFPRGMYFGGFPSGHVSQGFVAIVVVGHVWGLDNIMGMALVAQTFFTFIWVINANRHYISQCVAGFVLGAIYGYSAIAWLQRIHGENTYHAAYGHGWSLLRIPTF